MNNRLLHAKTIQARTSLGDSRLEKFMSLTAESQQTVRWLTGLILLVASVACSCVLLYLVIRLCWRAKSLIDAWLG